MEIIHYEESIPLRIAGVGSRDYQEIKVRENTYVLSPVAVGEVPLYITTLNIVSPAPYPHEVAVPFQAVESGMRLL